MDEYIGRVSLVRKAMLERHYLLIAQTAEEFSTDSGMLKALCTAVKRERKEFNGSKYPMTDGDAHEIASIIDELYDLLRRLKKANKMDRYRIASNALHEFIERGERRLKEDNARLSGKSDLQETIVSTVDRVKAIGEKLGKGVEEIKKTVKDLGSK